ncbi:MAG TPA: YitT family protein [Clostridiales bacterium]|nr:YitT family protein [Clostridiales bacterium]
MPRKFEISILSDYIMISFGTLLMSFGLFFFLEPNTIAPGGVTGFAILVQKLFGIPMDITNLIANIPLFLIGVVVLGKGFGVKTAYGTFALSFFIRMISIFFGKNQLVVDDLLLASLYGGILMGVGIGFVFRAGGTTGGTDLAGAILHKYIPHFSIAKWMMVIDLMIVASAGIIDKSLETSLYSIMALYILVKVADFIEEGFDYAKAFIIVSDESEKIGKEILDVLERGVTVLKGRGMYTGVDKEVLLCMVDRSQASKLKGIIHQIDPKAFVIVTTAHEVLGEGFKEHE